MKNRKKTSENKVKNNVFQTKIKSTLKTPFCCPVCNGKGIVPNGFYNATGNCWVATTTLPDTCRTCGGTGVVWYD